MDSTMAKKRKSLETAKGISKSRRAKPLVAKAGFTRKRNPYKYGGETNK